MFSSILLAGASSFILKGYLYFRKESELVKIFDELIKIESYDVDFVSNLQELPQDKDIIISGTILHPKKESGKVLKTALTESETDVVFNELVVCSQQAEEDENDHIFRSKQKETVSFLLGEHNDATRQMLLEFKPSDVYFYNIYKAGFNLAVEPYSKHLTVAQKLKMFEKNILKSESISLREYALIPNSSFSFVGRVSATTKAGDSSKVYSFIPKLISSDRKDSVLQHLDRYLVTLHTNGKRNLFIGTGIFGLHIALTKVIFPKPKDTPLPA